MADALTHSRRDYGAAPAGAPVTKTQERRLREQQASAGLQQEHAVPGLESRERQQEAACWSLDDFNDREDGLIEAQVASQLRKPSGGAALVPHQCAGPVKPPEQTVTHQSARPGKQPAGSVEEAQVHRQSEGPAIQPWQDAPLEAAARQTLNPTLNPNPANKAASGSSQLGVSQGLASSGRTYSGAQGQRIATGPQLPRTLQSFFRDVPSSGGAHQRVTAGSCAQLFRDSVRVVAASAAGSDEVRPLLRPWTKIWFRV